ncbi:MAG: hypothetical protein JWL65_5892 [Gammaproteobacteria bacterium]|nr:hypothetical protein [Gammaproteobacteria bacterium]
MALIRDDKQCFIHCNVPQRPDEDTVRGAQTEDSRMSQLTN